MTGERSIDRPSKDEVYTLLAERHRRSVLAYLAANGSSAVVPALARHLAERDEGKPVDERAARIRLRHAVLPRFTEAGIVSMDQDGHQVRMTPTGRWLDRIRRRTEAALEAEPG